MFQRILAFVSLSIVLFLPVAVTAQDRVDGYIGYQFLRASPDIQTPVFRFDEATDTHGFNTSITVFLGKEKRPVGITFELAANFESTDLSGIELDNSLVTFMGGVTAQKRSGGLQPFVRGLVGVARARSVISQFSNIADSKDLNLAAAGGGGLDLKVAEGFAIRLIQVDYLFVDNPLARHNLRLGAGLRF